MAGASVKMLIMLIISGLSITMIILTDVLQLNTIKESWPSNLSNFLVGFRMNSNERSHNSMNYIFPNNSLVQSYELLLQANQNLETSVKCVGHVYNQSCLYKNLYYIHKTFWILTTKKFTYPLPSVCIGPWNPSDIVPVRRRFYSYADLDKFVRREVNPIVISNLTLYFDQLWLSNIGHALFDGLYPAYVALIRFPPNHLRPFRILLSTVTEKGSQYSYDVYNRFSGLGIMNASALEDMSTGRWFAFEELVMGSGHMCQRCLQPNLQLPGGVELNGSRLFRDRMYKQHGLAPPLSRQNHSAERRYPQTPLKAYVIDNKRFTIRDLMEINAAIHEINNYTDIHKNQTTENRTKTRWPLIYVSYISYSQIISRNNTFFFLNATDVKSKTLENNNKMMTHLQFLQNIDIHITGPGTGQMFQTFLSDGSVNINLGGLTYMKENDTLRKYPSFMEQYVTVGTPYIRGLYYPINDRAQGIKRDIVIQLIVKAAQLIVDGFAIPVNPKNNLAPDGELFTEMCELDKSFCTAVTKRWQNDHYVCFNTWPEEIVHELQQWSLKAINGDINVLCSFNRTLLHQLKQKYNISIKPNDDDLMNTVSILR